MKKLYFFKIFLPHGPKIYLIVVLDHESSGINCFFTALVTLVLFGGHKHVLLSLLTHDWGTTEHQPLPITTLNIYKFKLVIKMHDIKVGFNRTN